MLQRFETPYAEIDILAVRPSGRLLICEVKSSFWPDDLCLGLGFRQRERLARAAAWINSETSRDVEIVLLGLNSEADADSSTRGGQFEEVPIF